MTPITLWLLIVLAIAIMFCTGMIYGCLKTIPRWNTWMTPAKYVLFGLTSGAVLLPAVLSLPAAVGPVGKPMVAMLLLAGQRRVLRRLSDEASAQIAPHQRRAGFSRRQRAPAGCRTLARHIP